MSINTLRKRLEELEQADEALSPATFDDMMDRFDLNVQGKDFIRLPPDHDAHDMWVNWNEMRWLIKAFKHALRGELHKREREVA